MKAKIQHEIQEYCSLLKLNAISEHFEEAIKGAADYEGFLHQLLRMEVDAEEERAKERKIKAAKFPYRKYIEDLEMNLLPEAMRKRLPELCSLDFIRENRNFWTLSKVVFKPNFYMPVSDITILLLIILLKIRMYCQLFSIFCKSYGFCIATYTHFFC